MPKLLLLQLLTNALNTSVNYMSDVFQHPVTKHLRKNPACEAPYFWFTLSVL